MLGGNEMNKTWGIWAGYGRINRVSTTVWKAGGKVVFLIQPQSTGTVVLRVGFLRDFTSLIVGRILLSFESRIFFCPSHRIEVFSFFLFFFSSFIPTAAVGLHVYLGDHRVSSLTRG